jgi:hypothetical protein
MNYYEKFLCEIKKSIPAWLSTVETNALVFKMSKNACDSTLLDATSLAYDLRTMLNIDFSEDDKDKAKEILDSYQILDNGFFAEKDYELRFIDSRIERVIEMHANYLTFQTLGAYKAIGRLPDKKITFYDRFIEDKGIKNYLTNNCPWEKSPWGAGGMVDNLGTILDCNIRMGFTEYQVVLSDVFEWLDENQSDIHGLWGNIDSQGINGLINGGYHLMRGTYFLQNRQFNFHEKIIDAILKDLIENDIFTSKEAHGCQDLDHFYLLEQCVKVDNAYRTDEIHIICRKRLGEIENIVYCGDGGFSFEARNAAKNHNYYDISPGIKESDMQGTVFYLQSVISILNILGIKHEFKYSTTHG